MLSKIRRIIAAVVIVLITLLFLDFTGTVQSSFGWLAKIQFLPALFALNLGVITLLVVMTIVLGRVYCSVICPLGIFQDGIAFLGKHKPFGKKNRYSYSGEKRILRIIMLGVMTGSVIAGISVVVALLAPYSVYGRMVHSLLGPVWTAVNNILADFSEQNGNYDFYRVEGWHNTTVTIVVAVVTLVALAILAWRNGRTYCNTICPVGTILGYLSKFSILAPVIDTSKCNSCGLCSRNCKASCINSKAHQIDYSRCVACMDCIDKCHKGAISYSLRKRAAVAATPDREAAGQGMGRRDFLTVAAIAGGTAALKAAEKTVDGGLAAIADKQIPKRSTHIVPPGALSVDNLAQHCTACQLCVTVCPTGVLRPSGDLGRLMQPESSYERGYCRPECTKCSSVCPTGAILPLTAVEKSSTQIGHAVWIKANCIVNTDGVSCGNCARHCPTGAITMVATDPDNPDSPKVPAVNRERCIGCGACENLCPARPFSAIYVEGHQQHRTI